MQRANNICPSFDIRRGLKRFRPIDIPSPPPPAQLAPGPHPEGLEGQIRLEQVAGGLPDHERAGKRTNGHVSPMT